MGSILSRLEALERESLLAAIEETHKRLGQALDRLSDRDMARFIQAINEAAGSDHPEEAKIQAITGSPVAGLSDAAKEGLRAWQEAGGAAAMAFSREAYGDTLESPEFVRAIRDAQRRYCRPDFHRQRARPYLDAPEREAKLGDADPERHPPPPGTRVEEEGAALVGLIAHLENMRRERGL